MFPISRLAALPVIAMLGCSAALAENNPSQDQNSSNIEQVPRLANVQPYQQGGQGQASGQYRQNFQGNQAANQTLQGQLRQGRSISAQAVRQMLQNAGFQDIRIVDAAYLIEARTADGNYVTMYIDPPSMVEAYETSAGNQNLNRSAAQGPNNPNWGQRYNQSNSQPQGQEDQQQSSNQD
jgi:hypothetical protein